MRNHDFCSPPLMGLKSLQRSAPLNKLGPRSRQLCPNVGRPAERLEQRKTAFFLIATGRGEKLAEVNPAQSEQPLNWVGEIARDPAIPFMIKTTEAHHYRRIMRLWYPRWNSRYSNVPGTSHVPGT